jgi:tRNA pseudouridine32 synthase/23S rRNA pseudouridine746 synthase
VHALHFYDCREKIYVSMNHSLGRDLGSTTATDLEVLKSNTQFLLSRLASKPDSTLQSIPRRCAAFKKYLAKNRKTLLPHLTKVKKLSGQEENASDSNSSEVQIEEAGKTAYDILSKKAQAIYQLSISSKQTPDEESALGQLNLLAKVTQDDEDIFNSYGRLNPTHNDSPIYVVHRLDCETSGIMVFARTVDAASKLCKAWRERDASKVYLARVKTWPPFEHEGKTSGNIDLPLAAMENERLKWEVKDTSLGGKPSHTEWSIFNDGSEGCGKPQSYITLELKPVTGRTHQLRVHCAAIGSGISADSLYGDNPIPIDQIALESGSVSQSLRLHAMKLSFPHPMTGSIQTFETEHCWGED